MGYPTEASTPEPTAPKYDIVNALIGQEKQLAMLNETVELLTQRLYPVIRPMPAIERSGLSDVDEPISDINGRIRNHSAIIDRARRNLQDILEAVDL